MSFGSNLRIIRKNKGITLKELSFELGVSINYLSKLELDKAKLKPEFIMRLCKVLEIDINDLFVNE